MKTDDLREQFEKWTRGGVAPCADGMSFVRSGGLYDEPELEEAWRAFHAGAESSRRPNPEHPHYPACNYWTLPIGAPGCICVVIGKKRMAELESAEAELQRLRKALRNIITSAKNGNESGQTWVLIAGGLIDSAEAALTASSENHSVDCAGKRGL